MSTGQIVGPFVTSQFIATKVFPLILTVATVYAALWAVSPSASLLDEAVHKILRFHPVQGHEVHTAYYLLVGTVSIFVFWMSGVRHYVHALGHFFCINVGLDR